MSSWSPGTRLDGLGRREVLAHFALDLGFGTFLLIAPPDPEMLQTFIEDVAPQVRERVATARADAPSIG